MRVAGLLVLASLCLAGCGRQEPNRSGPIPAAPGSYGAGYGVSSTDIKFLEHAESNSPLEGDISNLEFTTRDGKPIQLKDVAPGKTLILVMTRGYNGSICPYCSTQVSRLIANYAELEKRNAQVVVVYPLEKLDDAAKSDEFVNRAVSLAPTKKKQEVPFPLVLDYELKAVDLLGLRKDLSKPATYILDADGGLQFAYVGNTLADRPSVQALIEQLDKINKQAERS